MNKVLIVGNDYQISNMFLKRGWHLAHALDDDIDLVQFTGGEDVDPALYGQGRHPSTYSNPLRDAKESAVYHNYKGKVPMAGICRGAQFLNVMNGGAMWQHVTKHAISDTHEAYCHVTNKVVWVTSTHHQMMIPTDKATLLMTAQLSSVKQGFDHEDTSFVSPDIESVFYEASNSLCYQPHPEYTTINDECQVTYFDYIEHFFNLS